MELCFIIDNIFGRERECELLQKIGGGGGNNNNEELAAFFGVGKAYYKEKTSLKQTWLPKSPFVPLNLRANIRREKVEFLMRGYSLIILNIAHGVGITA